MARLRFAWHVCIDGMQEDVFLVAVDAAGQKRRSFDAVGILARVSEMSPAPTVSLAADGSAPALETSPGTLYEIHSKSQLPDVFYTGEFHGHLDYSLAKGIYPPQ